MHVLYDLLNKLNQCGGAGDCFIFCLEPEPHHNV
jgi:hypothetical protein